MNQIIVSVVFFAFVAIANGAIINATATIGGPVVIGPIKHVCMPPCGSVLCQFGQPSSAAACLPSQTFIGADYNKCICCNSCTPKVVTGTILTGQVAELNDYIKYPLIDPLPCYIQCVIRGACPEKMPLVAAQCTRFTQWFRAASYTNPNNCICCNTCEPLLIRIADIATKDIAIAANITTG